MSVVIVVITLTMAEFVSLESTNDRVEECGCGEIVVCKYWRRQSICGLWSVRVIEAICLDVWNC